MDMAKVVSVNISDTKGVVKKPVDEVVLREGVGVEGDAHSGPWHRQVSLLGMESIEIMRGQGLDVGPGDFAENITTQGLVLYELPVGTRLKVGPALLEVTQIGKKCHTGCAIFQQVGKCIMPTQGIFARVLKGGVVRAGDKVEVLKEG